MKATRVPELLAPAGDWECARAAVENGADAIYFGLEKFNARMRARNFTAADLPALMEFLHRRGVRGYVTFNTLVFQNELHEAEDYLRTIIAAGADAAIVQDVGICRLIRQLSPDFPIHASTQMTVTSPAGVAFVRELGCQLVVLARENSLKEIARMQETQAPAADATPALPLPLEVFVHGALCVAYSGQCLTSEALGGRSANRGECAQACRMPYELVCDGQLVPLQDRKYLLSPQDLAGLEVLPELVQSGVSSLKIEGRLKTPEYVAAITRVYRTALDQLAHPCPHPSPTPDAPPPAAQQPESAGQGVAAQDQYDMEMSFSRGLFSGWFRGINNQRLVHARFGKKRGVFIGEVTRVQGERVILQMTSPVKAGDGVVFDAGRPQENEEGGRVFTVRADERGLGPKEVALTFGRGHLDLNRIQPGDKVWKTNDPELDRRLRQSFAGDQPRHQRPVDAEVHGRTGTPLTLILRDENGHVVRHDSTVPLAVAEKQPLSTERLTDQLGRLGGTPFRLRSLSNQLEGAVILPVSELNRVRREAAAALEQLRSRPRRWTQRTSDGVSASKTAVSRDESAPPLIQGGAAAEPELIVLVRNLSQLDVALRYGVSTIYCDFEDPKKYREAVRTAHQSFGCAGPARTIWVAPPRIFKPGEEWILDQVRSSEADGYLVRNYDHLRYFTGARRIGDFSLNVANALAGDYFLSTFRLERVTASYDLNVTQLESLLQAVQPRSFEVTIHQHMPMFHMEHCVFCAFLSQGTDYTNCGRPCDRHEVRLRDRAGAEHVLKADIGCRNTVFNAAAQTGAEYVARLCELGLRHFRIEFVAETPEQVGTTIARYRQLLRGEITGAQLWRELKLINQLGVTRGTLGRGP
jgi:putative protease